MQFVARSHPSFGLRAASRQRRQHRETLPVLPASSCRCCAFRCQSAPIIERVADRARTCSLSTRANLC